MKIVREPARDIRIAQECDVLVAGGGIAGVAAAIAAARGGAKVILLEREYTLGGLATLGLITIYLPMDDGEGHQMVHGIGEELLKLSIKHGAEKNYPKAWIEGGSKEDRIAKRYTTQFNPHLFAIEMEQLLGRLGVKILYGTLAAATVMNKTGDRIEAVITENKSGREAIAVRSAIDATGDADLCHLSGETTKINPRLNALASWYYYFAKGEVMLRMFGLVDVPDDEKDGKTAYENDQGALVDNKKYTGVDGPELSEMVIRSHGKMMEDILAHKAKDETVFPVTISSIPLLRATRRIAGAYTMGDEERDICMEDSIGTIPDWRRRGPRYELPFRLLYGNRVKNLLAAGRDVSVTEDMWEITRVIPPCAVTGEAAGTAAAFCDDFANIDIEELQRKLTAQGVILHLKDMEME
jgi:hypothetical protein